MLIIGSKNAKVNEKTVALDVAPFIDSGRTFVPFRFIGESLGAKVGYTVDASGRVDTVTYSIGTTNIILYIGKREAIVNGSTVYLDVAPKILQGRTVIPLRFVTEALGCKVEWDGQKMQVTILRG
ncbi:MAG: copper amine oxidase N-terminal domain-containing protein [Caldisericia bacterium]|nr:copper amine oxidase N-terminal domain-containing protein [Caldisericia bacterium]